MANTKKNTTDSTKTKESTKNNSTKAKETVAKAKAKEESNDSMPSLDVVSKKPVTPREFSLTDEVECFSMCQGELVYVSRKTGETTRWSNFGESEFLTIGALIEMRNTQPKFFSKPWIMIEDKEVLEYLRVVKYYKGIPNLKDFDELFNLPTEEMYSKIAEFSDATKNIVAHRALELIEEGILDSRKTIQSLEAAIGFSLTGQ